MQPHIIRDPPPNFTVSFTSLSLKPSPAFFHAHILPSDPSLLILVSSDHTTVFQSSTVQSKVHPLHPMPLSQERLFGLDHSLQTSLFQVVSGCLGGEGLVGHFLKDLGDLGGILSLPGSDEVLGIMSISLRKLGRTSSWDFLQVGTVFSLQSGDIGVVKTSKG